MKFLGIIFVLSAVSFAVNADTGFGNWKHNFESYAVEQGITPAVVEEYVPNFEYLDKVVALDRKQPEFKSSFASYIKRAISQKRIRKGLALKNEHKVLLAKIEHEYGVPAPYLLAFWGLETHYGMHKGKMDTLNAVATLSYDRRRSTFFTKQLIALLKIIEKDKIDPPKGSWAGAFGHFQFMPTTYLQYAVDGDGDGRRDLVNSFPDAVASAANYLSQIGWNSKISWGRQVILPDTKLTPFADKVMPLKEWEENGFKLKGKDALSPFEEDMTARLVMPMGQSGPAFLVYSNFDVIRKWNRSDLYALSVGILADYISGHKSFNMEQLPDEDDVSPESIRKIQKQLKEMKLYNGTPDGVFGAQTRKSIKTYQKANQMSVDGYLSKELLEKIFK